MPDVCSLSISGSSLILERGNGLSPQRAVFLTIATISSFRNGEYFKYGFLEGPSISRCQSFVHVAYFLFQEYYASVDQEIYLDILDKIELKMPEEYIVRS